MAQVQMYKVQWSLVQTCVYARNKCYVLVDASQGLLSHIRGFLCMVAMKTKHSQPNALLKYSVMTSAASATAKETRLVRVMLPAAKIVISEEK